MLKKTHIFPGVPLPEVLFHCSGVDLRCRDIVSTPKVTAICSQDGEPFPRSIQLPLFLAIWIPILWKSTFLGPFLPTQIPAYRGAGQLQCPSPHSICTFLDLWGYLCGPGAWSLSAAPVNGRIFPLSRQPGVLATVQLWHVRISHHPKFVSTLTGAAASFASKTVSLGPWCVYEILSVWRWDNDEPPWKSRTGLVVPLLLVCDVCAASYSVLFFFSSSDILSF